MAVDRCGVVCTADGVDTNDIMKMMEKIRSYDIAKMRKIKRMREKHLLFLKRLHGKIRLEFPQI